MLSEEDGVEFEEDVSSGVFLKMPCLDIMDERELTQYKLHNAVSKQNITELRELLQLGGYNIDEEYALEVQTDDGCLFKTRTLLVRHLQYDGEASPEITHLLIEAGADVNLRTPGYWHKTPKGNYTRERCLKTPLLDAIYAGSSRGAFENTRILLKAGANPNIPTIRDGTPLIAACCMQCAYSVRILLKHGAYPNMVDDVGTTALTAAACNKCPEIIDLLFSFGADPDQPCTHAHFPKRIGSICAGVPACAALFKTQRIRFAYLEYDAMDAKLREFEKIVSRKMGMECVGDLMLIISEQAGFTSIEDRIKAIDNIARGELAEYQHYLQRKWYPCYTR